MSQRTLLSLWGFSNRKLCGLPLLKQDYVVNLFLIIYHNCISLPYYLPQLHIFTLLSTTTTYLYLIIYHNYISLPYYLLQLHIFTLLSTTTTYIANTGISFSWVALRVWLNARCSLLQENQSVQAVFPSRRRKRRQ